MTSIDTCFQPHTDEIDHASMAADAIRCVEQFTEMFNKRDLAGMDSFLHFPHVILSGERLVIWEKPGNISPAFFDDLAKSTGWAKSTYHRKHAVLVSPRKVHLVIDYSRDRADGSIISRHINMWIITFDGGRWGIKQRSY
jgi:hypothetical protein